MNFLIADLVEMDETAQTATIIPEGATQAITVPLWECAGFVRVEDNHQDWKYALTGE